MSSYKVQIKRDWEEAPYYELAEKDTAQFWAETAIFRQWFDRLDHRLLVELACGRGRHSEFILAHYDVEMITLVDINQSNILECERRFQQEPRAAFVVNAGNDLPLADGSATGLFCYDAMVHFEYDDVAAYLFETHRVLKDGGRALFHHSNNGAFPGNRYSDNPHWRNFMTLPLFKHMAMRAGLQIIEQTPVDWGDAPALDGLTLVEKSQAVASA